jgi:SAM-dependent methyltransferase
MTDADLTKLVDKSFWEEEYYWADVRPPCRPDPDLPFDMALGAALARLAPVGPGDSVIEIGCAPAKWLAFYGERFGAHVEGIEYSAKGAELSQANLDACGVSGTIREEDFFNCDVTEHDLVVSLGFIEHFDELESVFARHLDFVKPGGRLLIGVPNFRGLNRVLQRWSDPSYLALHNLRAMDPALYREFGAAHGLDLLAQEYIGGTDPIIVKLGPPHVNAIILAEARLRRLSVGRRFNHAWFAPYLLTVLRKPSS